MRKQSMKMLIWGAIMLGAFSVSGCFSRQLLGFQTHPEKKVLLMETFERSDYWLWSSAEHVYWTCSEQGDLLHCERRCGGDSDLVCPATAIFASGSNVQ